MLQLLLLFISCYISNSVAHGGLANDRIKHVVVLMMENRAFDHMLGFMKTENSNIDGCLPNELGCFNPINPFELSKLYTVTDKAVLSQYDPIHEIDDTTLQIYGMQDGSIPLMNGFISSYSKRTGNDTMGPSIMDCFPPAHVPIITTLAKEYAVFDNWYASVPGPTMPNRAFAASASSAGMGDSDVGMIAKGLPQKTMYRQLLEMGLNYSIYYQQVPALLMFKDLRHKDARPHYHHFSTFFDDVSRGDLPEFTWIEPIYTDSPNKVSSDQHPPHDVSVGEQLMKDIYEALRASPLWNETAFIITYDEHGGFFDHVAPPVNAPSPDNISCIQCVYPFNFDRSGIRVPTVMISPWVTKGKVVHTPTRFTSQYEHSSFPATIVHKIFKPRTSFKQPEYLNARDAWARTFEWIFEEVDTIREDCVEQLPQIWNGASNSDKPAAVVNTGNHPISDFHRELIAAVKGTVGDEELLLDSVINWTENDASLYFEEKLQSYFKN